MVERDYDVVYKSRVLDRDEERPRIPTALDPFDSPYGAEPRHRREYRSRGGGSRYEDDSTTEVARSTNKTTYSARDGDRDRDDYADDRRPSRAPNENTSVKRSVLVDQERDDVSVRRSKSIVDNRSSGDRRYIDLEVDRSRDRGREYYIDDRPRPIGAPYVIDSRDVIDVIVPGRMSDREYGRDGRQYRLNDTRLSGSTSYGRDATRDQYSRSTGDVRGSSTVVTERDHRSRYDDDRSSRAPTRGRDHDRDEDWRLVDSMKETRISSAKPPPPEDNYSDRQSRARVQAYSSEDDYVMVAPNSRGAPTKVTTRASSAHRSAIARSDYPEPELRRRRSRSISFRGSQVDYHDASERKHERPGAEAQICGPYLRRPMSEFDERSSIAYSSYDREGEGRRSRVTEMDRDRDRDRERDVYASQVTYRERDEPYPPQSGFDIPRDKKRDRSRRRRRREDDNNRKEDDDDSYYSENIIKKTTTKYR